MRSILTISMPLAEKKKIEKRAKMSHKTVSAYILDSLKFQEKMIQEDEILKMAERAEKDYREGKIKNMKSFEELI